MSDSPPKPLTDRNGVVCPYCWRSIDLTDKSAIIEPKPWLKRTWTERLHFHTVYSFHARCQHCGKESCHETDQVIPLEASWEEQKQLYEDRIRVLRAELEEARTDNKVLAKVAHDNLPEAEEPDLSTATPRDTLRKPPTPPKGPELQKDKGPYT